MPTFTTSPLRQLALVGALLAACAGCGEEAVLSIEVKQPDQPLTEAEWTSFRRAVEGLGPNGLNDLPGVFPPAPDWPATRTLPVSGLADAEQRLLADQWEPATHAGRLTHRPGLARVLRREQLTAEQLIGLTLTVGAALARSQLPEEVPFDDLLRRDQTVADALAHDERIYSLLETEDRYAVLDRALSLHRIDRLKRMQSVPAENVALLKEHHEWLRKVLPACFHTNPLAAVQDRRAEHGVPFVEHPITGSDAAIEWDPSQALGRR
jgi:hypothetical protein